MLKWYHEHGFNPILLEAGGKKPLNSWKEQQDKRLTLEELKTKATPETNIGIVTGELRETGANILGLDFDSELAFREVYPKLPESPMIVKTLRGYHAYYSLPLGVRVPNSVHIHGAPIDIRHHGGYLVAPDSRVKDFVYQWLIGPVAATELPLFPIDFLQEKAQEPEEAALFSSGQHMERASRYVKKIDSISGQGGHNSCFRVCCKLRDFGLVYDDAWTLLLEWNQTNAKPKWSERELTHKLESAYLRKAQREDRQNNHDWKV